MPGLIRLDPTAMRLNRRRFAALAAASVASVAVGDVAFAQATPAATPSGAGDAVALLKNALATMAKLKTFHFELDIPTGSATILQGFQIKSITGDVRRPYDFKTDISVSIPLGSLDLTVIGLNGQIWLENPLAEGGKWSELTKGSGVNTQSITTFVNPDVLILQAVHFVQDAKIAGHEKVGGVQTTRVDGTVSLAGLARMKGAENAPAEISTAPIPVSIWIDKDNRIQEIELAGQILTSESTDVIHDITFSNFDKPVDIQKPTT